MDSRFAKTSKTSSRGELPDPSRVRAAKIRLLDAGLKVAEWAEQNGESRDLVHKVLSGRRSCLSGASHRIAVKLGIVDESLPPEETPPPFPTLTHGTDQTAPGTSGAENANTSFVKASGRLPTICGTLPTGSTPSASTVTQTNDRPGGTRPRGITHVDDRASANRRHFTAMPIA